MRKSKCNNKHFATVDDDDEDGAGDNSAWGKTCAVLHLPLETVQTALCGYCFFYVLGFRLVGRSGLLRSNNASVMRFTSSRERCWRGPDMCCSLTVHYHRVQ